ncbi:MAG TPA: hypothetical protein VGK67_14815 [Myxococcales bacterium]|jgi:thioredoxin 1
MNQSTTSLLALLALLAGACARGEAAQPPAPKPSDPPSATAAGALPRLVFFMNPNGRPCQMQDQVLQDMTTELKGKVEVVRYKTTQDGDLAKFEQFGIRSLPMLVITDGAGNELKRATPGIQNPDSIRRLIAR